MYRKKPGVDVIMDILDAAVDAYPDSAFVSSLWRQYQERGGLSKKQLQGLYGKASKIKSIPANKLATLEAEILKKPTRYKSEKPAIAPLYTKDERVGKLVAEILEKYPQHKRVMVFKLKWEHDQPLSSTEIAELEKFHKLLV
jgi:hypothetical protein